MSKGLEKIRETVKRELAEVLAEARDPRLSFLTLMDLKLSPDLRHATAFISVLNEDDEALTLQTLQEHSGHFRSELAQRLRLKRTPELKFELDEVEKRARHLEWVLNQMPHD